MGLGVVTILAALLVLVAVNAERGRQCQAYNGKRGVCIKLRNCHELLNMAKLSMKSISSHQEAMAILQKSNCGFIDNDPLVCCPNIYESAATIRPEGGGGVTVDVEITSSPQLLPQAPESGFIAQKFSQIQGGLTPPLQAQPSSQSDTTPASETTTVALTTDETLEKTKLLPEDCGRVLTFKYFNGNLTEFDDFPWATLVEYTDAMNGKRFACGGALINKRYVLTAAHCVTSFYPRWSVSGVRLGEYNTATEQDCMDDGNEEEPDSSFCAEPVVDVPVEEAIVHPAFLWYDRSRLHDVALLRLAKDVEFTGYVQPICLPLSKPVPQRFYTSGWGNNGQRDGTDLKYMSYLTTAEPDVCNGKYNYYGISLAETQICAGAKPAEKPCIGDLGTPLMGIEERPGQLRRVTAFGVLSLAPPTLGSCEESEWPGLYTKVLDYVPWILSQIRE